MSDLIAAAKARKLQAGKVKTDTIKKNPAFLKCQLLEANARVFTKVEPPKPKPILNARAKTVPTKTVIPPNPYETRKNQTESERIAEFKNTEFLDNGEMEDHMERRRLDLAKQMKQDILAESRDSASPKSKKNIKASNVIMSKNGKVIPQNYAALYRKAQTSNKSPVRVDSTLVRVESTQTSTIPEPEIDEKELEGLNINDDVPEVSETSGTVNEEDDA